MDVRTALIAGVRTGVQRLITIGVAALTAFLASRGLEEVVIDLSAWTVPIDVVVTSLVTAGLVKIEKKWTWLTKVLSLGLAGSGPKYETA